MERREFLRLSSMGAGSAALYGAAAESSASALTQIATSGPGPYGSIEGRRPDENGLILPLGFTSRVIAVSGEDVGDTRYQWPVYPDGGAVFDDPDSDGWIYVCNSEVPQPSEAGGVSAIRFDAEGEIIDAYSICEGTISNCAGGPTPWGTWLSCEEYGRGRVWECDPTGARRAEPLGALGLFAHEAVAVVPETEQLFMTEDTADGRLYRFTPDAYPSLDRGKLDAAEVDDDGNIQWLPIPDPEWDRDALPPYLQAPGSTLFAGGEGIWYHDGSVFFTTKVDNRVHRVDVEADRYELIYEVGDLGADADLRGVDNITVEPGSGDLYVAEDGDDLQVVVISTDGDVAPFVQVTDDLDLRPASEITGPCFSPAGDRMYFSSQRGGPNDAEDVLAGVSYGADGARAGITYEITGPFRGMTLGDGDAGDDDGDNDGPGILAPIVAFGAGGTVTLLGAGAVAAVVARRNRQAEATNNYRR